MKKIAKSISFLLIILFFLSGCASLSTRFDRAWQEKGRIVYPGVREDVKIATGKSITAGKPTILMRSIWALIDLPFSFAFDTFFLFPDLCAIIDSKLENRGNEHKKDVQKNSKEEKSLNEKRIEQN
ncbi:MAG: hypothetical protein B5M48_00285 [Candidatus Omnitrophica bacterium 4484_213]|nr:MAG: hypothetical protein B5M48_00285 [Candidatus Omnitrophica bacterium 4484_213]